LDQNQNKKPSKNKSALPTTSYSTVIEIKRKPVRRNLKYLENLLRRGTN